jgi:hypothetical protein
MNKRSAAYALHARIFEAIFSWELDIYADALGEKKEWDTKKCGREHGREPLVIFLVQKYGWTVDYCRSLNDDDLRLALADELKSWKIPKSLHDLERPYIDALKDNPATEIPNESA